MQSWIALLIAVTATAIGYGIDAGMGHKELTHVFAGFYIAGCLAAVLAVRQDGIFTAIIQPPLILFVAVPGAYWLFHDGKVGRLKDLLINCGYPLIERFPLMLGTAGAVLLIGLARWYFGMSERTSPSGASKTSSDATAAPAEVKSFFSGIGAKLQSLVGAESEDDATDAEEAPAAQKRRGRTGSTSARARRSTRGDRSTARSSRTRSRHARPSLDDGAEPDGREERPRRSSRRSATTGRDYGTARDGSDAARRPRRRPRPGDDADATGQPPRDRDGRREPRTRRSPYERPYEQSYEPRSRSSRFDGYADGYGDKYGDGYGQPERPSRYDDRDRPESSYEPRRRRPSTNGTHHPVSQVRYRGAGSSDPGAERRGRSRTPGRSQARPPAESWEYDA